VPWASLTATSSSQAMRCAGVARIQNCTTSRHAASSLPYSLRPSVLSRVGAASCAEPALVGRGADGQLSRKHPSHTFVAGEPGEIRCLCRVVSLIEQRPGHVEADVLHVASRRGRQFFMEEPGEVSGAYVEVFRQFTGSGLPAGRPSPSR
jgi:hypothetical protein